MICLFIDWPRNLSLINKQEGPVNTNMPTRKVAVFGNFFLDIMISFFSGEGIRRQEEASDSAGAWALQHDWPLRGAAQQFHAHEGARRLHQVELNSCIFYLYWALSESTRKRYQRSRRIYECPTYVAGLMQAKHFSMEVGMYVCLFHRVDFQAKQCRNITMS